MGVMTRLLLLLWAGVAVSTAVDLHKRIIGGAPCLDSERLYHVKLVDDKNHLVCGGSLISKSWILTAAHCWLGGRTMAAVLGVHTGNKQETVPIAHHLIYSETHDITLLKLSHPADFPLGKLPDDNNCKRRRPLGPGAIVQIAGHASAERGKYSRRVPGQTTNLQCADIEVEDCQAFKNISRSHNDAYIGHIFCGRKPGVDTSFGDSGGGVVYNHKIYGVHSSTGDPVYADRAPVAFLNVCAYLPWIRQAIH